jgi:hypothetical protein
MDKIDEERCKTLCIPRTDIDISEPFVRNIFNNLNIGIIGRIDLVKKQNEKGGYYMRIFIHINKWYNTENAHIAKERLLNGKDIKIIYDDPWFWKISVYKPPSHVSNSSSVCPPPPLPSYNYGNNKNNYDNRNYDNKNKYKNDDDDDDNWRKPRRK